ncbi:MAG: hypothetical protein IPI67_40380 [Myxococcales bacterium]|nr:hypothetical protein [Myxococcales bacterium]
MSTWSPRALVIAALAVSGCYDTGAGVEPPLERIYFPVGLALSPGQTRLYVVNSDFDLQYNGGSLQAFDLTRLRELLPKACESDADCPGKLCDLLPTEDNGGHPSHWCVDASGPDAGKPCGPLGEKSPASKLLQPGRCSPIRHVNPQDGGSSLVVGKVGIGAFATDVIYRPRPTGPGGRLFIPVRGDATLHYVDVIDDSEAPAMPFELDCGQAGSGGDCDDNHRRGDDPDEENTRDLRLAPEPFGIAATPDAEAIVVTHQTEGAASLFVSDADAWGDGQSSFGVGPKLQFTTTGLPQRVIGAAALPVPLLAREGLAKNLDATYDPGFLVTFRDAAEIDLLRYFSDAGSVPARPFMQVAGAVGINANSLGFDSRGIAVDGDERLACEVSCPAQPADARFDCLRDCAAIPLRVYVANRAPSSLLVGKTRPNQSLFSTDDLPQFQESIPLTFGPSRVLVGKVISPEGQPETRVFVVCFDSRKIGIYNPKTRLMEDWIETGRGPHALVTELGTDPGSGEATYAHGYVGHFTDSYLGVIDLDQRHPTYGTLLATVGKPNAPRASK